MQSKLKEKKWLILVTNNIKPYMYDVPLVLALPEGFTYRFRYTVRWFNEKDLKSETEALIVVRDVNTAKLYPIRHATVEKIYPFGFIRYIEFSVRNFVPYSNDINECQQKIDNFAKKVEETLGDDYNNIPKTDMTPLVFLMNSLEDLGDSELTYSKNQENEQWCNILQLLSDMTCYSNLSFLKIESLKSISGDKYLCKKLKNKVMGYKVSGGNTYSLNVLQSVPYDPNTAEEFHIPHKIELQTEEEVLFRIKGINHVVGKYDLLHFIFKAGIFVNDIYTYLEIIDHQCVELPGMLPVHLPLVVEIGKLRKTLRWLRMAVFIPLLLVFIFAESVSASLKCDVNVLRNIVILALALCVGGFREILTKIPQISIRGK
ncbi:hypothetical protein ES705_03970 [subsurface metagenome]